jgi:ribose 5-phosphate isomerase B
MRIVVGADHRGYALKDAVAAGLREGGYEVLDVGTNGPDSVDYPDIALAVGEAIREGRAERGVLVCGSGVGAAIAACKLPGIRVAPCHDTYSAHQGVEHDDMNVLCLGSEVVGPELAAELTRAFLTARFDGGERYVRRLEKIEEMERETTYG